MNKTRRLGNRRRQRMLMRSVCESVEPRRLLSVTPVVVDLLALYTPGASAAHGGNAAIEKLIRESVDAANSALINSEIAMTIRLVHSQSISYTGSGNLSTDRERLRNGSDGHMD